MFISKKNYCQVSKKKIPKHFILTFKVFFSINNKEIPFTSIEKTENKNIHENLNPNETKKLININSFLNKEKAVPSNKISRLYNFGSLALNLGSNIAKQKVKHFMSKNETEFSLKNIIFSQQNVETIVNKLSQVRGAALKFGQMISIQDKSFLPEEAQKIFCKLQNSCNIMPKAQLEKVMISNLGENWRDKFYEFDFKPFAAASIGQVHNAITIEKKNVVIKVQYPGVEESIDLDLEIVYSFLKNFIKLPPGLFLDKIISNSRLELKKECDYIQEANNIKKYKSLLLNNDCFTIPNVYDHLSSRKVLTMDKMTGDCFTSSNLNQSQKNLIVTKLLELSLLEIKKFKFSQTDANWGNFFFNTKNNKLELIDFGFCVKYNDDFISNYVNLLKAGVERDTEKILSYSLKLKYLTGFESLEMTKVHVDSILILSEPFSPSLNNNENYDFSKQTITSRIRKNAAFMLKERLISPPQETYSLHRKLSGVFLLATHLNAVVNCQKIFDEIFYS